MGDTPHATPPRPGCRRTIVRDEAAGEMAHHGRPRRTATKSPPPKRNFASARQSRPGAARIRGRGLARACGSLPKRCRNWRARGQFAVLRERIAELEATRASSAISRTAPMSKQTPRMTWLLSKKQRRSEPSSQSLQQAGPARAPFCADDRLSPITTYGGALAPMNRLANSLGKRPTTR
jgi:hypothetical protein